MGRGERDVEASVESGWDHLGRDPPRPRAQLGVLREGDPGLLLELAHGARAMRPLVLLGRRLAAGASAALAVLDDAAGGTTRPA